MIENYRNLILSYLATNKSFGDYHNVLIKMKEEGITSEEALAFFYTFREKMIQEKNEEGEDMILDVLDIIVGYCSEHLRIWQKK